MENPKPIENKSILKLAELFLNEPVCTPLVFWLTCFICIHNTPIEASTAA